MNVGNCGVDNYSEGQVSYQASKSQVEDSCFDSEALKLSLIEAVASAAMLLIALPFLGEEDQYIAMGFTAMAFVMSFVTRQVGAIYQNHEKQDSFSKTVTSFTNLFSLSLLTSQSTYVSTLIHESGHYMAIKYVDSNIQPVISLSATGGGNCTYGTNSLIKMNEGFIASAGPMADMVVVCACIALAHFQKTKSNLSIFLHLRAALSTFHSFNYARSAFQHAERTSHDYAVMWNEAAIHPIVSMINIAALPLLAKMTLQAYDKFCETGEIPLLPDFHARVCKMVQSITDEG